MLGPSWADIFYGLLRFLKGWAGKQLHLQEFCTCREP